MKLPKDMTEEEKSWFGLVDILMSVSSYQNKHSRDITVEELLAHLKNTNKFAIELDLGWIGSHQCRMYIISTFCKRNNLFFDDNDEITRDTPKYLVNSREDIWDECVKLGVLSD